MSDRNQTADLQYHRVERTLRRIKFATMPSPPKSIAEISEKFGNSDVKEQFGRTRHNENIEKNDFYRTTYVSDDFSYSVFASQRIIDIILTFEVDTRRYMMDATFKVVPSMFYQLLVIYFETPSKQVQNNLFLIMNNECISCWIIFSDFSIHFHSYESKNRSVVQAHLAVH